MAWTSPYNCRRPWRPLLPCDASAQLVEADHSQLKHRLRPMRGLRTDQTAQVIIAGHAFIQNLRRGHDELGLDSQPKFQVASAFSELARAI
ncbi:DDE-type integrase/transposase/recombinase [Micromonospora sp. NPDC047074]|uniref:DDE-type integrase/transposase/recombinase n=1 Tax=Micromonospora sp. NPDC047074 TaxID=3154339 RepID=UPI0034015E72